MASYFESGFTALTELAKEKQKEKQKEKNLEDLKDVYDDKFRICEDDKACTQRMIEAFSDCD